MPARTALLLVVLFAATGGFAWNAIRVGAPEPRVAADAGEPSEKAPSEPATTPAAVSRDAFPKHVADGAHTLRFWAPKLARDANGWMRDLGIDFHIVTLAADAPIEELAPEVFEVRRVGVGAPTGGVLLLLNPARREARIELSYELESVFPDALIGRMASDQLAPYASYSAVGMAVMDVLHLLKDFAYLRAVHGALDLGAEYRESEEYAKHARFLSGGGGAQVEMPDVPLDADLKARVEDTRRGRYAPSEDPRESLAAFLRATGELAGDPTLDLFTPGSQEMRARYPLAPYEEFERLQRIRASQPLRLATKGDRAVFTSESPAPGFVPVLMHRSDGLWRVDLTETWKNLFFGSDGEYFLRNSNHPYTFGLGAYGRGIPTDIAPWDLGESDLHTVIETLEGRDDALSSFLLAELLFRNCFAAVDALRYYEEAVLRAKKDTHFRKVLGDRASYLGLPELAIPHLFELGPEGYRDLSAAYYQANQVKQALHFAREAVERNPFDRAALAWLRLVLRSAGERAESDRVKARIDELDADPKRPSGPVALAFEPAQPVLVLDHTTEVGGTEVFDWSDFGVTLTNQSGRTVAIEKIHLRTHGTGSPSGLGDIKNYWTYPSGADLLRAGESVRLQRIWGFTIDTQHEHLSYLFEVCWRGVDGGPRQCDDVRLETYPL